MTETAITKKALEAHIASFLEDYRAAHDIAPIWRAPIAGFADAHHPLLARHGVRAAVAQAASTFDRERLVSHWSHRHFAYLAGLGTFGINNMLITRSGGCGRYTSVVTDLDITPGQPLETEYCLYKKNGKCGACLRRCPTAALTAADGTSHYDRHKCFAILKKNAEAYQDFGSSYTNEDGRANSVGSEVCGKCTVHVPCALRAPGA